MKFQLFFVCVLMTVHFNSVPCCAGQALDAFTSRHLVAEYDLVGVCVKVVNLFGTANAMWCV